MSNLHWTLLLPIIVVAVGLVPVFACLYLWQHRRAKSQYQNPLTRGMLRSPGYSLRTKIDDLSSSVTATIAAWMMLPALFAVYHIADSHYRGTPESLWRTISELALFIVGSVFIGSWVFKRMEQLRRYNLGLQGELATGQELDQLMLEGCRVFHDIPIPHGNVDHVVVSRSGVFTVNTKIVGKPKQGEAKAKAIVNNAQNHIEFPGFKWRIPKDQLEGEARWLSNHLSGAMGESIDAEPILAIPGWFITERIGRSSVYVINPVKPKRFFVHSRSVFSDTRIGQIAHHLEQLCRDVQPGFQDNTRWEDKR
ncbi:nuclease-related domain-containing protein [Rosistilla oblonga]|uniref:nuclease-related domain-containing protein n=1 Tax=Rosistilla oblonga TaxID=2527990 RepID=UPI003A97B93E